MKKQFLTITMGLLLCITLMAQTDNRIMHLHGAFTPSNNISEFVGSTIPLSDVYNGYYYRYIQFNNIPTQTQKNALELSGIKLLSYMPHKAFAVAIPFNYNKSLLLGFDVKSVLAQDAFKKRSKNLIGDAPAYATTQKGFTDVRIQFQKNIPIAKAIELASSYGKTGSAIALTNTIEVRVADADIAAITSQPWCYFIDACSPPSFKEDTPGRSLHRSDIINTDYPMGRHYNGSGTAAALADDGEVGPHIDFTGRLNNIAVGAGGSHGDMTGGILAGAGNLDPRYRGMADGTELNVFDIGAYPQIIDAVANNTTLGTTVSSTSYSQGCNEYTSDTQFGDQTINDNGQLEFVFSAGNNQGGNCNYGAGAGWGTITGGYKQGKNVIAVANLDALEVQDPSSSQGPASDGRIKPDIAANGRDQMSTAQDNTYQVGGGTSAACPGIAGITLQLTQAYKEINSATDAPTALLKASLLNSAEDIGVIGPDFKYGYGRVNAYRAVKVLEDNTYFNSTIAQGGSNTHSITVPAGVKQLKVLLYWHDVGGDPVASTYLVNDLDMVVTDPASVGWFPWILDPTPNVVNLTTPAIRGADHLNNIEQFTYDNPASGTYTVNISGFSIPQGPQEYYLVYEFRMDDVAVTYPGGAEGFVPGEQEILRWDALKGQGGFNLEYSTDNGSTWNNIATGYNQNSLQYTWTVPNTPTGEALVKVSTATASGTSFSTFTIIGVPQNFAVDWVCVDSLRLEWDPVAGASSYEVSRLGTTYMDSVATTSTNSVILSGTNPNQDYWFSVRAVLPNGAKGRRAIAIFRDGTGVLNCPLAVDVQTNALLGPGNGTLQDCQNLAASSVTMEIENRGQTSVTNIPVYYSLNGGTPVSGTYTGTIAPFTTATYTFAATINLSVPGIYNIQSWISYAGDLNNTNDTATSTTTVIAGVTETLPYVENFDSYTLCGTNNDCEATVCNFGGGWINETNLSQDDIDFRINTGGTPSANTGPDFDHTSGSGNYAYTEASVCFDKKVTLVSPCIDLTTAVSPSLSFWYHMYGASMGELHVDIFANGVWVNDIIPSISGDQGNQWLQASTNLTSYIGGKINIRFRGTTGPDFTSDIAIDDINVYETSAPPIVNFNINNQTSCVGGVIQLTDLSNNNPTSWSWSFAPNTVTFVNGTTATSQNPQVQLNGTGTYDITLTATNAFGSNSTTQTAAVIAVSATLPPITEDFQAAFPPLGWSTTSSVGSPEWNASVTITGSAGTPTIAAYFNNFNYNNPGSMDYLKTMELDLTNAISAVNTFDVAYARYNAQFSDTLIVAISTDCGNTYTNAYIKGGVALATVADQTAIWQPTALTEWRNDTVDLNSYLGQKIIVAFINLGYFGNSLFLDNINVDVTTGIENNGLSSVSINVTPNPSEGIFKLDVKGTTGNINYMITDVSGRKIMSNQLNANTKSEIIDLSKEGKGSYILYVNTGKETKQVKLVVM